MEEAVTRKFVHEDSSHIIALCGKWHTKALTLRNLTFPAEMGFLCWYTQGIKCWRSLLPTVLSAVLHQWGAWETEV